MVLMIYTNGVTIDPLLSPLEGRGAYLLTACLQLFFGGGGGAYWDRGEGLMEDYGTDSQFKATLPL